jgi:hypothetical protein
MHGIQNITSPEKLILYFCRDAFLSTAGPHPRPSPAPVLPALPFPCYLPGSHSPVLLLNVPFASVPFGSPPHRAAVMINEDLTASSFGAHGSSLHRSACFDSRAHHQLLLRDAALNSQHSSTGCACTISRQQLLCLRGLPLQRSISLFLSLSAGRFMPRGTSDGSSL